MLLTIALVLAACGSPEASALAPASILPDHIHDAPQRVQESYRFAVSHPEALEAVPCYCGCGAMGHTSNLSCFVQGIEDDGSIAWDNHALGCGICVDIAQDVMRLSAEGESLGEIRSYVDATYASFGPPTNTPLP